MDPEPEDGESSPATDATPPLSTVESAAPVETEAPIAAPAPSDAEAATAWPDTPPPPETSGPSEAGTGDTLSPAVRRLVRQYDLDVTGIHGTGPAGKIRVGDIIGMLDGRAESRPRANPGSASMVGAVDAGRRTTSALPMDPRGPASPLSAHDAPARDSALAAPVTAVFECDLSRVLGHRKRERRGDTELLLASYWIAACVDALSVVPEIAAPQDPMSSDSGGSVPRLGVLLATTDGGMRRTLVHAGAPAPDERLRTVDAQLRAHGDADLGIAQLLIHYHGPSGSLLATPTALGHDHVASLGVGRVRREIVLKTVDGEESPRVTAVCYVTVTFRPDRIALERANRFVAEIVRVLEHWPLQTAEAPAT